MAPGKTADAPVAGVFSLSPFTFAVLLLGFAFLSRLPLFFYPFFNGDEATYHTLARALWEGRLLYVEAVDHKPPLIYFTYALLLAVSGQSLQGIHVASVVVVFCTGLLVTALAGRLGLSSSRSRLAGVLYVLLSVLGPGKDMLAANAEIFMLLPTVGAALLFVRGWQSDQRVVRIAACVGAGTLCGLAFLYKYQGGAILGALVCFVLLHRRAPLSWARRIAVTGWLLVGFVLPVLTVLLRYHVAGEVDALYFWAWKYPFVYAGQLSPATVVWNLLRMTLFWAIPALPLLLAAAVGWRALRHSDRETGRWRLLAGLWLGWSVLGVFAGGRFFLHYYLQLVPPLALLASCVSLNHSLGCRSRNMALAYLALFFVGFWISNAFDQRVRPRIKRYTEKYTAIASWVRTHAPPAPRMLVWGNSPEIYFFSGARMGTRFPFCNYLSGKIWGTRFDEEGATGTAEAALSQAWPMLLSDLARRKPELIVDAAAGGLDRWKGHEIQRYERLWRIVRRNYELAATVVGARVWRRRR